MDIQSTIVSKPQSTDIAYYFYFLTDATLIKTSLKQLATQVNNSKWQSQLAVKQQSQTRGYSRNQY